MIIKKKMKKMVPMTQMLINIALCDEFSFDHVDLSFRSPVRRERKTAMFFLVKNVLFKR